MEEEEILEKEETAMEGTMGGALILVVEDFIATITTMS